MAAGKGANVLPKKFLECLPYVKKPFSRRYICCHKGSLSVTVLDFLLFFSNKVLNILGLMKIPTVCGPIKFVFGWHDGLSANVVMVLMMVLAMIKVLATVLATVLMAVLVMVLVMVLMMVLATVVTTVLATVALTTSSRYGKRPIRMCDPNFPN